MLVIWLGALLVLAGVVLLAAQAIWRGRLSERRSSPSAVADTLEPRHRGMRFLGLGSTWPGILLAVAGGLLLLTGGYF
jgi:hypothetical protein